MAPVPPNITPAPASIQLDSFDMSSLAKLQNVSTQVTDWLDHTAEEVDGNFGGDSVVDDLDEETNSGHEDDTMVRDL